MTTIWAIEKNGIILGKYPTIHGAFKALQTIAKEKFNGVVYLYIWHYEKDEPFAAIAIVQLDGYITLTNMGARALESAIVNKK